VLEAAVRASESSSGTYDAGAVHKQEFHRMGLTAEAAILRLWPWYSTRKSPTPRHFDGHGEESHIGHSPKVTHEIGTHAVLKAMRDIAV